MLLAQPGKGGIFRQKAVARVDGLGPGDQGGADEPFHVQVALSRGGGADADALVRQSHVEGVGVGQGVDRHSGDAHLLTGPDNAQSDLPPIGNQNF